MAGPSIGVVVEGRSRNQLLGSGARRVTTQPPGHGLGELVRTAHGDAWQVEGRLREPYGGGVCAVRGARAMASGIRTPKWNNADVTHEQVDLEALSAWYAARGMPWGLRVPLEISLAVGEPLFVKRCMGLMASSGAESRLRRLGPAGGVEVRPIRAEERDRFVALEVAAFGDDPARTRAGLAPQFGVAGFDHWVAELAGTTVGIATSVRSDELAGPAVMVTGMAALPGADARLVKAQLSGQISAQAVHAGPGATLVMSIPMTMRRPPRSRPLGSSKSPASWSGSSNQPDHRSPPPPPPRNQGTSSERLTSPLTVHSNLQKRRSAQR